MIQNINNKGFLPKTLSEIEAANLYSDDSNNLINASNSLNIKTFIQGNAVDDTVVGGGGNDNLIGGRDDDFLKGDRDEILQ